MTAEPAPPSGEPRVIALLADSALRFTDLDGQPIPDIPVVPGETIRFEVNNTAGFGHNLWIGTDAELSTFGATTDVGIPDWTNGVEVLEWVVPEDIAGLKFACTVAGHYYTMQGTFSVAEGGTPAEPEVSAAPAEPDATAEPAEPEVSAAPAEPEVSAAPAEPEATAAPAEPEATAAPAEPPSGEARVIDLEADAAIRFLQDGQQIRNIEVTPGETVVFRIENTAGFAHNFFIGPDAELQQPNGRTDIGLPDWDIGFQELEWVVPDDLSNLRFACTVPGHYFTMQGDFVVSP
jgi:uncharacterized cupredoxin-like copper-binding protein